MSARDFRKMVLLSEKRVCNRESIQIPVKMGSGLTIPMWPNVAQTIITATMPDKKFRTILKHFHGAGFSNLVPHLRSDEK